MVMDETKPRGRNGGRRPGAGRKPNPESTHALTAEIRRNVLAHGVTPLEVMCGAMREAYSIGGAIAAFPYAEKIAPYVHPRLSSVEAKVDAKVDATVRGLPVETLTDQQLQEIANNG